MKNFKTNLSLIILLTGLAVGLMCPSNGNAVEPTFNCTVKNFQIGSNELFFDIYLEHTNLSSSGPFQLALNEYHFNFNPLFANGRTLSYTTGTPNHRYVATDVNGDNVVDAADSGIVNNNAFNFVHRIVPPGAGAGPQAPAELQYKMKQRYEIEQKRNVDADSKIKHRNKK